MGSIDGSKALVKSYGPERDCLLVESRGKQKFAAINEALPKASGNYIYILEPGDRFSTTDSLGKITAASQKSKLTLLSYRNSSSGELTQFNKEQFVSEKSYLLAEEFPLCSLFWSKAYLIEAGAFDESYMLCAQKKLLAQAQKSLSAKDLTVVSEGLVNRDAGNLSYLHQYSWIKVKESRRAVLSLLSRLCIMFKMRLAK